MFLVRRNSEGVPLATATNQQKRNMIINLRISNLCSYCFGSTNQNSNVRRTRLLKRREVSQMPKKKKIQSRELRWVIEILNRQYKDDLFVKRLKDQYRHQTGQNVECFITD